MNPNVYSFRNMVISGQVFDSLKAYVEEGQPVGHFLAAIICNDLKEACIRADDHNFYLIPAYVGYLYNEAPSKCWGSKEAYNAWIDTKQAEREDTLIDEHIVKHIGDI